MMKKSFIENSKIHWHRDGLRESNDDTALIIGCLQRIASSMERQTDLVFNFHSRIANLEKENKALKSKVRKLEAAKVKVE